MTRSLSNVFSSTYSMLLIALMLGSIAVAMVPAEEVPPAALLSEPEPQFASSATSPGHVVFGQYISCLLYTSPSPRDATLSRMPSSA